MCIFRPLLNQHGVIEPQWRVVRLLRWHSELDGCQLITLACILEPNMSGVLARLERDGMVVRRKVPHDQRRLRFCLTEKGQQWAVLMGEGMEASYQQIQEQFDEVKLKQLLDLLNEL
jgi:homoprotocatechuate degradation regulator HpaR